MAVAVIFMQIGGRGVWYHASLGHLRSSPCAAELCRCAHAAPQLTKFLTVKAYRNRAENVPSAARVDTDSMSTDRGRSSETLADLTRTTSYAFFASAPVCSGASRSIPWQAHSNSIAMVFRK